MAEKPFKLFIPDDNLELLHKKLQLARLPDELEDAQWDYGVPLADIKRLVSRWENGYDWRKYEAEINNIPQFTRDIEVDGFGSLNIHYVHQKSSLENAIPLLFMHGWPGHFMEVSKLLPLLTEVRPNKPSFHVVTFSLPGFGFSEAPKQKGFAVPQYAELANKLMISLGYNEYVTQGGDWGYFISRVLCNTYGGKHAKAWHTNCPFGSPPSFWSTPLLYLRSLVTPLTAYERLGLERTAQFRTNGYGYAALHRTKPQTLGYSLADSPVGLLAWIYEKLISWTDNYPWTDDEVLNWISLYWFSRPGPAASLRIYYEGFNSGDIARLPYVPVPSGLSLFPMELQRMPKLWAPTICNVVLAVEHDKGGHFAAHEVPEAIADDLRKMFEVGGPAFGVVTGKTGYPTP
ncbi:hypothetical protein QCA50_006428 [Cerrena zonata]|uniref:Epoxide hydrolase N-terminal domain-containing protein n=1 Tax=Cerrena zonata TaxID=2478898 RepID=A0AAW0GDM1_9APHY